MFVGKAINFQRWHMRTANATTFILILSLVGPTSNGKFCNQNKYIEIRTVLQSNIVSCSRLPSNIRVCTVDEPNRICVVIIFICFIRQDILHGDHENYTVFVIIPLLDITCLCARYRLQTLVHRKLLKIIVDQLNRNQVACAFACRYV